MKFIIFVVAKLFYVIMSLFLLFSVAILIIPIIGIASGVLGALFK